MIIKDGFNWLCFFFGIFWSLYRGVWLLAGIFGILLVVSLFTVNSGVIHATYIEMIRLSAAVILSFHANDFFKWQLQKNGYRLADIIVANDGELALQRFLDMHCKKNYNDIDNCNRSMY